MICQKKEGCQTQIEEGYQDLVCVSILITSPVLESDKFRPFHLKNAVNNSSTLMWFNFHVLTKNNVAQAMLERGDIGLQKAQVK